MCGQIVFLAVVLGGIETGWQPLPEGGVQYLIQIDRELLESRGLGDALKSDVPSYVHDVRAVRITMGTGPLPRELPPAEPQEKAPAAGPGDQAWVPTQPDPQGDPAADPSPSGPTTDPFAAKLPPYTPLPPQTFVPPLDGRPIVAQPAIHEEPVEEPPAESESTAVQKPQIDQQPRKAEQPADATIPSKPWWPLTFAFFGLFASLGVNGFLLWIVADFRSRYRALLRRTGDLGVE